MPDDYQNAPVSHYRFEGPDAISFMQSVAGIGDSTPVEGTAHQDAKGNPNRPKWWSRATSYSDITIQRLLDSDRTFYKWREKVKNGEKDAKTDCSIIGMTADGEDVMTISIVGAWPSAHQISGFSSGEDSQAYELITLSCDSWTMS